MGELPTRPPIVIVDDDPDALFLLTRIIARTIVEHRIVTFDKPEQALLFFERAVPNVPPASVLFCDVCMPGMSGFDLVTKVRSMPSASGLSIWMISSSADEADLRRAYRSGANGYLAKYPTEGKLLEIIGRVAETTLFGLDRESKDGLLKIPGTVHPIR
jgi:CheY-like chemotaxis protein